MKATIKPGASCQLQGQLIEWPANSPTLFEARPIEFTKRWSLTAPGYGYLGRGEEYYGKGPVIVMDGASLCEA